MKLSKKRLLLLGLTLPAAALLTAGCGGFRSGGGLATNPGGAVANAKYVGSATCVTCHGETHQSWENTKHAQAFTDLKNAGQAKNAYCLGCHTVGYKKPTGFVDEATTPNLEGVQCESCHGPGSEHRGDPTKILKPTNAEVCGQCHQGTHSHFYEEWSGSAHAAALTDLRSNSHASDRCLECHSADYRLAKEGQKPTLATAKDTITCVVCHNPHSNAVDAAQLRKEPGELCIECHTSEGATYQTTTSPHHPHSEFLDGVSGAGGDLRGVHSSIPTKCVKCHVYSHEYVSDSNPAQRGHAFEPNLKACSPCHTEAEAQANKDALQSEITAKLAALKARLDAVTSSAQKGTSQYKAALYNYNFIVADGSKGVHNPQNARKLIDYANQQLDALSAM